MSGQSGGSRTYLGESRDIEATASRVKFYLSLCRDEISRLAHRAAGTQTIPIRCSTPPSTPAGSLHHPPTCPALRGKGGGPRAEIQDRPSRSAHPRWNFVESVLNSVQKEN